MIDQLPSAGWSPTIPRTWMVTQHPRDGHISALGWSPIIQNYLPKQCCPASQGWSPTIPSMVTHHPKLLQSDQTQQLQLNKEFDTSAAQLVFIQFHISLCIDIQLDIESLFIFDMQFHILLCSYTFNLIFNYTFGSDFTSVNNFKQSFTFAYKLRGI